MKRAAAAVQAFYANHAPMVITLLVLAFLGAWALFLFVSEEAGGALVALAGLGALPFLPSDSPPYGGAGGADPTVGIGADFGSGPYLGG